MRREMFERRHRVAAHIPSVSMGDIAFLLLIFFMATTIFKTEEGIDVRLPHAETARRHEKDDVMHVWVDQTGRVWINNRFVETDRLNEWVAREAARKPAIVVAFNADERAPYRAVAAVLEELKEANATRVSFTSEPTAHAPAPVQ
ncbi:MAG TPA: biopolymer transporter ExbD [Candidatus Krumholzibacteria bacterium]|nr:biopolymer transporter ExbD [Candidatus Krumholzibacteria bacterium]